MTTVIRSCPAEHSPRLAQFKQLQKEVLFCCLTRQKQHYRTTLQVFGRSCIEDALTSFQQTAFCLNYLLVCSSGGSFLEGVSSPEHVFFLSVNCSFPLLHTRVGAPTLSLFWQHSTVCVLYKTICFVSVQEHNARLLSLTVGKAASLRYHHLIQQTPLVPSLLLPWKAFVVQLLLFFCLLASCWHCKSETVAPSGASTTVAPGTVSC